MDVAWVALVGVLLVLLWAWRQMKQPKDKRPQPTGTSSSEVRREVRAPSAEPEAELGRWRICYHRMTESGESETTTRVVRVKAVRPRLRRIEGWCELRQAERVFSIDRISEVVDAKTGDPINLEAWLRAYNSARRRAGRQAD